MGLEDHPFDFANQALRSTLRGTQILDELLREIAGSGIGDRIVDIVAVETSSRLRTSAPRQLHLSVPDHRTSSAQKRWTDILISSPAAGGNRIESIIDPVTQRCLARPPSPTSRSPTH